MREQFQKEADATRGVCIDYFVNWRKGGGD
jgi:hypothetical protein